MSFRAGVLTISDKGARGEREDTSGAAIRELVATIGASVERYEIIPDETALIADRLRSWADEDDLDLILHGGHRLGAPRRHPPGHPPGPGLRGARPGRG